MPKRKKSNLWLKKPKRRRFPRFVTPKKGIKILTPKKTAKNLIIINKKYDRHCNMRPSQGVGVPVEKGIYFSVAGEQRPNFEGKGRKKDNIGEQGT